MAGILPDIFGIFGGGHGVLPFGDASAAPNLVDANRNAILGYLAGALQGGNLGQSIGRGLQGWLSGAQSDATSAARGAAAHYVAQQGDIDPGMRSVLMQNPALAMQYLQARLRPHATATSPSSNMPSGRASTAASPTLSGASPPARRDLASSLP